MSELALSLSFSPIGMPQQIGELPFKVEKEVFGAAGEGLGGLGGVWADWQLNFGA